MHERGLSRASAAGANSCCTTARPDSSTVDCMPGLWRSHRDAAASDLSTARPPHRHGDGADELTGPAPDIVTTDGANHALHRRPHRRLTSASDDVRRALDAALARLESLAGWTSHDLCLPLSAQRCYLRSLESAWRAEEPVLAAHALGTLGSLYVQAGHFPEALQLFRLGALPVQDVASPSSLRVGLALSEAQAHAGLGNVDEVQRALRRAEEHYARVEEGPDEWVGTVVLPDHSELPAGRAHAYSRLASHDQRFAETAIMDMTEALTLRDPGRVRAMLIGRITLATNQYRCGETDLANITTEQVLSSINQVSSPRTARDLITLGTEIHHVIAEASHFLQEDAGPEIGRLIADWLGS